MESVSRLKSWAPPRGTTPNLMSKRSMFWYRYPIRIWFPRYRYTKSNTFMNYETVGSMPITNSLCRSSLVQFYIQQSRVLEFLQTHHVEHLWPFGGGTISTPMCAWCSTCSLTLPNTAFLTALNPLCPNIKPLCPITTQAAFVSFAKMHMVCPMESPFARVYTWRDYSGWNSKHLAIFLTGVLKSRTKTFEKKTVSTL